MSYMEITAVTRGAKKTFGWGLGLVLINKQTQTCQDKPYFMDSK